MSSTSRARQKSRFASPPRLAPSTPRRPIQLMAALSRACVCGQGCRQGHSLLAVPERSRRARDSTRKARCCIAVRDSGAAQRERSRTLIGVSKRAHDQNARSATAPRVSASSARRVTPHSARLSLRRAPPCARTPSSRRRAVFAIAAAPERALSTTRPECVPAVIVSARGLVAGRAVPHC